MRPTNKLSAAAMRIEGMGVGKTTTTRSSPSGVLKRIKDLYPERQFKANLIDGVYVVRRVA